MAATRKREQKAQAGYSISAIALNVRAHPHTDRDIYVKLFKTLVSQRLINQYYGDKHAAVTHVTVREGIVEGTLSTFVDLTKDDIWGDPQTGEEATEEEIDQIVLPSKLKPKFKTHKFIFDVRKHRLFADASKLSGTMWHKAISRLMTRAGEHHNVEVDVTEEPVHDSVKKILAIDVTKLIITLERPNPTDLSELDDQLAERLAEQNARRQRIELTAVRGETLEPNQETKDIAEVAKSNGRVTAIGKVGGARVRRSTANYIWNEVVPVVGDRIVDALRVAREKFTPPRGRTK